MQAVRDEVAKQTCAVTVVFAPAEIRIRTEVRFLMDLSLPAVPIEIRRRTPILDIVIPLAFRVVPHVRILGQYQLADRSGFDKFGSLMPGLIRANLRADLQGLSGALDCFFQG